MTERKESLHVKCSWKFHWVEVSVPDFCPGVAGARLVLLGLEGVPGNAAAAAESTLRVLWINGTQTCKGSPETATTARKTSFQTSHAGLLLKKQNYNQLEMSDQTK